VIREAAPATVLLAIVAKGGSILFDVDGEVLHALL